MGRFLLQNSSLSFFINPQEANTILYIPPYSSSFCPKTPPPKENANDIHLMYKDKIICLNKHKSNINHIIDKKNPKDTSLGHLLENLSLKSNVKWRKKTELDENHKPYNMLQTSKRSRAYIPERLCGMDGKWPVSSSV